MKIDPLRIIKSKPSTRQSFILKNRQSMPTFRLWRLLPVLLLALMVLSLVFILLLGFPVQTQAAGQYHYVALNGDDSNNCSVGSPCRSIQHAIDKAMEGDEILVASGVYTGAIVVDTAITLRGGLTTTNWFAPPDPVQNRTTLDAQNLGRVIHIDNVAVTLDGFDIINGNVTGDSGGGVYNENGELTLTRCRVYNNRDDGLGNGGGGIASSGNLFVRNSQIFANISSNGGTSGQGGGISIIAGTATLEGNHIFDNLALQAGGGIYVLNGDIALINNLIYNNTCTQSSDVCFGGALYVGENVTLLIDHNTIYSNTAKTGGGGSLFEPNSTIDIVDSLIISNTSPTGGGIYNFATLSISFTDFYGNETDHIRDGGAVDPPTIGTGNRITNPLFIDPDNYDLHLSPTSPAIDSGAVTTTVTTDFEGEGRPFGSGFDRGADEYTLTSSACYARVAGGQVHTSVQQAVDNAPADSTVQVAGVCQGVESRSGFVQTVYISQGLTLQGGYTLTNWTNPHYTTILDAQGLGRVIRVDGSGDVTVERLYITGGQADDGGGVYLNTNGEVTLRNNVIYRNEVTRHGAGVYNYGRGDAILQHNTIYSNTADTAGGGVYARYIGSDTGVVTLRNNLLVNNGGTSVDSSNTRGINSDYNNFYGNTPADFGTNPSAGSHDLFDFPGLIDPDNGNFHLDYITSEVVDRADPASPVNTDFENDPRPLGVRSDIGADESVYFAAVDISESINSPYVITDSNLIEGQRITFSHTITNIGQSPSLTDSFLISVVNSLGWNWQLVGIASPVVLPASLPVTFDIVVTAPAVLPAKFYNQIVITATSETNEAMFDRVADIIATPGITLIPSYTFNENPGTVFTYTHTLMNTGPLTDTIELTYSESPFNWTQLLMPSVITVGPGQSVPVYAVVMITDTAAAGSETVMTITAYSPSFDILARVTDTTIANPIVSDRYVRTNGKDANNNCSMPTAPCATIGYALGQSIPGDDVKVAQGTYVGSGLVVNNLVNLLGGYNSSFGDPGDNVDPALTIIDIQSSGQGLRVNGLSTVKGFTLKNGNTAFGGAGIAVQGSASPTLTRLIILDSATTGNGGGIYLNGGRPVLQNIVISNTVAGDRGGGIYINGGQPVIQNVTIDGVQAVNGGGLYNNNGTVIAQQLTISNSIATGRGGGVYNNLGSMTISQTSVYSNSAASGGGGLYNAGGNMVLWNNFIYSNTTATGGGGVYNAANLNMVNDTLFANQSSTYGGGVYHNNGSNLVITNTIIVSNTAATGGGIYQSGGTATLDYNDIWGNTASSQYNNSNIGDGPHSISENPLFLDAAAGNLHLANGSPAIDVADPNTFLRRDIENDVRPSDQGFDMGADERSGCLVRIVDQDRVYNPNPVGYDSGPFGVLQFAVDQAPDDYVIQIQGICKGVQPRLVSGQLISQTAILTDSDKSLTLEGGYGGGLDFIHDPAQYESLIDPEGLGRGVVISSTDPVWILDLTIVNGQAQGLNEAGGALYINDARVTMGSTVISNSRASYGGGLYASNSTLVVTGSATLKPSEFVGNAATDGGGIYVVSGTTTIYDGHFEQNQVTQHGGGIYNDNSTMMVERTRLISGTALQGGAVYNAAGFFSSQAITATHNQAVGAFPRGGAFYNHDGQLSVVEGLILENQSDNQGGGFYNAGGNVVIARSTILSNTAPYDGGGIYNTTAFTMVNTIVAHNTTNNGNGGGIYNASPEMVLRHNTIYGNDALGQGGGVYHNAAGGTINSTLVVRNSATSGQGVFRAGSLDFRYNGIFANLTSFTFDSTNITQDPLFLSTDPASEEFLRLEGGSPAEDAADDFYLPVISDDIDGDPRPSNQGVDIGADEISNCFLRNQSTGIVYGNVQIAVNQSQPHDLLQVAGTCQGVNPAVDPGTGQTVTQTVFLTKSLRFEGGYNPDDWDEDPDPSMYITTFDALNRGRVVYITGTAVVSMSGLHIRQGNYDDGGAVFVGSSVLTMSGNLVYSSTATHGGAFYNRGMLYLIDDNRLFGNTATNGGGVYNAAGQSMVDDNDFQANSATHGGAFYHAGGISLLQNNIIRDNRAVSGGHGGGVYNAAAGLTVRHNTLYNNRSLAGNGGGFYTITPDPVVVNNIFHSNDANSGPAMYGPAEFTPNYNNVYPQTGVAGYGGGVSPGANSLVGVNPQLVEPLNGDFHLAETSPVLDKGDPTMDYIFDFEDHLRPGDQGFDMGADERQSCYAQVTYVGAPESRTSGPIYGNLQWAINHSNPGDEIRVSRGICRGVHPYNDGGTIISQTIHITHDLVLRGGWDRVFEVQVPGPVGYPDDTASTLDARNDDGGSSLGRVVFVASGTAVEMQRFNVVYGDAAGLGGGPGGGGAGGGLYYDYGTSGETQMVDFYYNRATYGGGFFNAADNLVMRNTWAEDNQTAEDGGTIYHATGVMTITVNADDAGTRIINSIAGNRGGAIYNASGQLWLVGNDDGNKWISPLPVGGAGFGNNQAVQGGAIYNNSGQVYLTNNDLAYNIAEQGGAIYNNTGGRVEILAGNEILGNSATAGTASGGGALYNSGAALLDHGSRLSFNNADQDGGAIFNNGNLTLQNTLIYANTADSDGGGLFEYSSTNSTIIHNTFYNNTGAGTGGAIQVESGSNHNIQNNIFEANSAGLGSGIYVDGSAGATVNYNVYWQNTNSGTSGGADSINEDPLLLNPSPDATADYEPWDFHLYAGTPSSPAIDAGDDLGLLYDFEDDPRPVNIAPDMGADEYDSCLAKLASNGEIYGRIGDALDEAINGDRIDVAEGVCTENVQIDKDIVIEGSWLKDFSGKVTIDGNSYIATTVYGLSQASSVINIPSLVNSADLSWLEVTHGDTSVDGGGLSSAADTLQLSEMEFVLNSTSGNGGAIALSEGTVDISNVYMYQNEAGGCGGGLYVSGNTILDQSGMGAYDNTATSGGGECFVGNAGVTIRNLAVKGNRATTGDGGGIRAANNGLLHLTNLLLYTNTAAMGSGGGIYRSGNTASLLAHNTIRENYAANEGGGVYNQGSSMTISASIVTSNTASSGNGIQAPNQVNVNHTLRWANGYAGSVSVSGEINKPPRFLTTFFGPTNELHYTSPAINVVPDSVSAVGFDKTPENRPHMCVRDMGWDEYDLDRELQWTLRLPDSASLAPTESVTYTFDLYNRSRHWMHRDIWSEGYGTGYTETITLTLEATRLNWPHEIVDITNGAVNVNLISDEEATFDLGPGDTATIQVRVTVPAGTLATIPGDSSTWDNAYLHTTATPWGLPSCDPRNYDSSVAQTMVELDRSFVIEPDNIGLVPVRPGDTVAYTHILTNKGNITDTYNIQPGNDWYAGGQLAVTPTQIVNVGPGMTATIVLSVTIDEKAAGGLVDRSSVIGASNDDPSIFTSAYNETPIAFITGTRYVALGGADLVLFEEEDIIGYNIPDNNCTVVDTEQQYPCQTIQHALNQAAPGDVIKIAQGVYTNIVTVTHQGQDVVQTAFISKPVSLQGGFAGWQEDPPNHTAHPTIIDPQGLGRGFYITSTGTVTLDRLVIRNGNAAGLQGGPANQDAGGLIYNEGAVLALNATHLYSSSADLGGGLYHRQGALLLQNSMLHNNDAGSGGAVYVGDGPTTLENNTFYQNQATADGGALYAAAGDLAVHNTIFAANTGAAVSIAAPVIPTFDYNLYHNNLQNYVDNGTPATPPGSNNQFGNPQFVNPISPDLHLQLGSAAIDNGSPILALDYDNDSRPQPVSGLHDIGADERVPQPGILFIPNVVTNTVVDRDVVITHTLQNTGETEDTFAITYTIDPPWTVVFDQLPPYSVTLGVNEIYTMTVTYTVPADPGAAVGTAIITASSGVTSAYVVDQIFINAPEWEIAKTVTPADSVQPGGMLTYTLTITNIGDIATTGTYTVSDQLPEYTHFISASDSPVTTTPVVQWVRSTPVATNQQVSFSYVVTVSRPLTDNLFISNQLYTVSGGNAANEAGGVPVIVPVDAPAQLTAFKTAGEDPVQAGGLLTYTITITNDAAALGPALNVAISDTLPTNVVPLSIGFMPPATGTVHQDGAELGWRINSIWPGHAAQVTAMVRVRTPLLTGTILTNTYQVTAVNIADLLVGQLTTTVASTNNISMHKTVQPETTTAGEVVTYTITLTNTGNGIATISLTDALFAGFAPTTVVTNVVVPGDNGTATVEFTATTPITAGLYVNPVITATYDLSQTVVTNTAPVLVEGAITGLNLVNDSPTSVPQATTLTATITGGSSVTYALNFGDGAAVVTGTIAGGVPVTQAHTYVAGTYIAIITATNNVDTQVATTTVIVDEDIAGLTLTNDSPTALGQATTLTATLTAGSQVTYTLDFGDGSAPVVGAFTDPTVVNHTYVATGTFTAIITAANSTSSAVATTTVEILPPPARPILIAPPNGTLTNTAAISLTWSRVADAAGYTLHLSDTLVAVPGPGASPVVSPAILADGVYTWTVEALNSLGHSSGVTDTWTFTVDTEPPAVPQPLSPLTGTTVTTNTVPFTWTASTDNLSGVANYTIVVTGPTQIYVDTLGAVTSTNFLLTPDGVYTWTIQAIDAAGNPSGYSTPITFTVDATQPESPFLIAPPDGTITNTQAITLEWSTATQALTYTLYLSDSIYAIPPLGSIGATVISPTLLDEGVYTWTVRAMDAQGRLSNITDTWAFTIDLTPPLTPALLAPPNGHITTTNPIMFNWTDVGPDADYYNLQLTYGVSTTIYGPFPNNSTMLGLPYGDGVYTWTVEAVDAVGNASGYTDTWTVQLAGAPPLRPQLISPISGTILATDTVTFDWSDTGAVTYTLSISDSLYPVTDTTHTVPGLADGVYTWTVAALGDVGQTNGFTDTWVFTVDTEPPDPPQPITPLTGAVLPANPVAFGWTTPNDNLTGIISYTIVVTGPTTNYSQTVGAINFTDLTLGGEDVYTWVVQAIDGAGNESEFSQPITFTLDLTPPLTPTLIAPPNGTLTNTATVDLVWSRIDDAMNYRVHLSDTIASVLNPGSGATVLSTTVLADGVYTWTVEAVDDFMRSSGITATWTFTVDTSAPSVPTGLNPPQDTTLDNNTVPFTWTVATDALSGVTNYTVVVTGPGASVYSATVGTITGTVLALGDDGDYTWVVQAIDAAGNASAFSNPITFTVDANAPEEPVLIAPPDGAITNSTAITLEWSRVDQTLTYTVHLNGDTYDVPQAGGASIFSPTVLAEGVYTWTVEAIDDLGRSSGLAPTWVFTIDTTAPAAPTLIAPLDGTITSSNTITFTWSDVGPDADHYNIQITYGITTQTYLSNDTSALLTLNYGDGDYLWTVEAVDAAGNTSGYTATWTLQLQGTPPPTPALISPISGTLFATDTVRFEWSDTGAVTYTLAVSDAVYATPATNYTVPGLADGVYTWTVAAYSVLSLTNGYTDTWLFTVDTTPPLSPTGVSPAAGELFGSNTVPFTWTVATDALSGVTNYTVLVTGPGASVYSATVGTITGTVLTLGPDDDYTWVVQAIDAAGNVSAFSNPLTFTVNATAPEVPVLLAPPDGTITNTTAITLAWGRVDQTLTYTVHLNGDTYAVPQAGSSVIISPTVLGEGVYTWTVEAIDDLGRSSGLAPTWVFTIDTTAPDAPTLIAPPDGHLTNTTPITFTWSNVVDADHYNMQLSYGGWSTIYGSINGTSTSLGLVHGDGVYSWTVEAVDNVGNASGYIDTRTIVLDTTPPTTPTLIAPIGGTILLDSNVAFSWSPSTDNLSSVISYTIIVTNSAGAQVAVQTSTATAINLPITPDGVYTWTVQAIDQIGNVSAPGGPETFRVDAAPPERPTLIRPPDQSYTNNPNVTFEWSPTTETLTYTLLLSGYAPLDLAGTLTTHTLPEGVYTWTVQAIDNYGRTEGYTDTWRFTVDTTPPDSPALQTPTNGQVISDTAQPTFDWSDTLDQPGNLSGPVTYTFVITRPNGSVSVYNTGTVSQYTPGTGLPSGVYTWTVIAYDQAGNASTGTQAYTVTIESTVGNVYLPIIMKDYTPPPPRPDLVITEMIVNGNGQLQVTARNQGNVPVPFGNNFHVNVYRESDLTTPLISWGMQASWFGVGQSRTSTYSLPAGTYVLRAWADPWNVVVEQDETNNIRIDTIVIPATINAPGLSSSEFSNEPLPTPTLTP